MSLKSISGCTEKQLKRYIANEINGDVLGFIENGLCGLYNDTFLNVISRMDNLEKLQMILCVDIGFFILVTDKQFWWVIKLLRKTRKLLSLLTYPKTKGFKLYPSENSSTCIILHLLNSIQAHVGEQMFQSNTNYIRRHDLPNILSLLLSLLSVTNLEISLSACSALYRISFMNESMLQQCAKYGVYSTLVAFVRSIIKMLYPNQSIIQNYHILNSSVKLHAVSLLLLLNNLECVLTIMTTLQDCNIWLPYQSLETLIELIIPFLHYVCTSPLNLRATSTKNFFRNTSDFVSFPFPQQPPNAPLADTLLLSLRRCAYYYLRLVGKQLVKNEYVDLPLSEGADVCRLVMLLKTLCVRGLFDVLAKYVEMQLHYHRENHSEHQAEENYSDSLLQKKKESGLSTSNFSTSTHNTNGNSSVPMLSKWEEHPSGMFEVLGMEHVALFLENLVKATKNRKVRKETVIRVRRNSQHVGWMFGIISPSFYPEISDSELETQILQCLVNGRLLPLLVETFLFFYEVGTKMKKQPEGNKKYIKILFVNICRCMLYALYPIDDHDRTSETNDPPSFQSLLACAPDPISMHSLPIFLRPLLQVVQKSAEGDDFFSELAKELFMHLYL